MGSSSSRSRDEDRGKEMYLGRAGKACREWGGDAGKGRQPMKVSCCTSMMVGVWKTMQNTQLRDEEVGQLHTKSQDIG